MSYRVTENNSVKKNFFWRKVRENIFSYAVPEDAMNDLLKNTQFYGWKLSWLICLANFCLQGSGIYLMNAFMEPLCDTHGWSRGDLGLAMGIGSLCGTVSMSLLSTAALYCSLSRIIVIAAVVGSLSIVSLGFAPNISLFTLAFSSLWVAGQACGGVIGKALMSNWFERCRGRAFGIANLGTSLSGAILPFVALLLLEFFSLEMTAAIMGLTIFFLLTPLCLLFVVDKPADKNTFPDGLPPDGTTDTGPAAPCTWKALVHCPSACKIGLAFGLGLMMSAGVVGQLKPRFSDLGFSDAGAMSLMVLTAAFAAAGKYFWGWTSDKLGPLRTAKLLFAANILGLAIAFLPQNVVTCLLFATCCGLFLGGFWTMYPAFVAAVFGRNNFTSAYRFTSLFIPLKSLGYVLMGFSFDFFRTYDAAYMFFMLMLLLGYVLIASIPAGGRQDFRASCL